jgi:hypothetical protein
VVPKQAQVVRCVARAHGQEHSRLLRGVARVFPILPASLTYRIDLTIPFAAPDVAEAPDALRLRSVAFLWPSQELLSLHLVGPLRAVWARVHEKFSSPSDPRPTELPECVQQRRFDALEAG